MMAMGANAQNYQAVLSGENETHLVTTMATGTIEAMLEDNMLTVTGSFEGLSSPVDTEIAGGAHIHLGFAGQDGPVEFVLTPNLSGDMLSGTFEAEDNMFELDEEQVMALDNRMLYVNIHTTMFGAGELRGQIVPEADQIFRVTLNGDNEVPPVTTTASGALVAELNDHSLIVTGSFTGLTSPVAVEIAGGVHIHLGLAGQNGEVAAILNPTLDEDMMGGVFMAEDNMIDLSHSDLMALTQRATYVNIHSEMFPAGELRGQITPQNVADFSANLSGAAEVHEVMSSAMGAVIAEVNDGMLTVTGAFEGLSSPVDTEIAGGAHIHSGVAGTNGDVEIVLVPSLSSDGISGTFERSDNTFELTEELAEALFNRELYVNIHTTMFGAGELRGQLLASAQTYFKANLSGLSEADDAGPVLTDAMGKVVAELNGNILTVSGAFTGLTSDLATEIAGGAHIHVGMAGENGPVAYVLNVDSGDDLTSGILQAENNMFEIDDEAVLDALLNHGLYVNIHSEMFPAGEIRGQLLAGLQFFPDMTMIESPEDGAMIDIAGNMDTPFEVSWSVDGDEDGLVYIWELAADEMFENTIFITDTGSNPMFSTTFETIDMLLDEAGVMEGESIMLFHRAYSSNGSLATPGAAAGVTLTRGILTNIEDDNTLPISMELEQNYPNPFNPTTNISFSLPSNQQVTLEVFNPLGQRVATLVNSQLSAGSHNVSFDASALSSGVYIYRLTSNNVSLTRKMMLVK